MTNNESRKSLQRKRQTEDSGLIVKQEMDFIVIVTSLLVLLVGLYYHRKYRTSETQTRKRKATPSSSKQTGPKKKIRKRDPLANAICDLANSIKELLHFMSMKQVERPTCAAIHDLVFKVPDLSTQQKLEAYQRLKVDPGDLELLSSFNDEEKKNWIELLLSRPPN